MTDIVIAGAARTPVGAFNGGLASLPAHKLGEVAIVEAMRRAAGRAEGGVGSHHGPDPRRRRGPEPGAAGGGRRRHPVRGDRLRGQPAVRLGAAHGRARLPGDPQRRQRDRRRRRPGEHEPGAALHASAQRRQDGRRADDRHDDQGRAVGRLQRLPHGQHRRECRAALADHPRAAGRVRRPLAGQGRGGAEGGPLQGRDRAGQDQDAARRDGRRYRRAPEARHHGRGAGEAAPGLRQERHGHRRQRLRHQ